MRNRESSTPKIDKTITRSIDFELTIADLARRGERRAWRVAFGAIAMALILAIGYFYMLPLKEKVPYVVMADAYAGTSTVARLTEDFGNRRISTSEAINRSNIAHFVMARESYDAAMLNLRDWATTLTMSSPGVAAAYTTLYGASNPGNPYKTYGQDRAIRVRILSIVLLGGGPNTTPRGATVRFQRSLYNKQNGASQPMDNKLATLEFSYKPDLQMDDQNRVENPLGFQVTSYRVDNDYDSSPPAEVQRTALPSTNAAARQPSATEQPVQPSQSGPGAGDISAVGRPASPPATSGRPNATGQAGHAGHAGMANAAPAQRNTADGAGHR